MTGMHSLKTRYGSRHCELFLRYCQARWKGPKSTVLPGLLVFYILYFFTWEESQDNDMDALAQNQIHLRLTLKALEIVDIQDHLNVSSTPNEAKGMNIDRRHLIRWEMFTNFRIYCNIIHGMGLFSIIRKCIWSFPKYS